MEVVEILVSRQCARHAIRPQQLEASNTFVVID